MMFHTPFDKDRVALEPQKQRRDRFRFDAVKMRVAPAFCPLFDPGLHRCAPAKASARA
jgi:hypothetical protein